MIDSEVQNLGRVLIVSADFGASRQISDALREHGLSVETSVDILSASERVNHRKYEAVAVDFSLGHRAMFFLQQVRNSASNRTAVTFAITINEDDTAFALKQGFTFVLERPLTAESIGLTLRVAYGMIVRERRRYFRHPIVVPVVLQPKAAPEIYARTVNISEGGMAICTSMQLTVKTEANVEFTLFDPKLMIKAEGKVCWQSANGDLGLSFSFVPVEMATALQQWLAIKLEEQFPSHVAEKFGRTQKS